MNHNNNINKNKNQTLKGGGKGGANNKKPSEYTFCRVCRCNNNQGPKHKFHVKHKSTLDSLLTSEAAKIAEFKSFASQRLTGGLFAAQRWCVFCDKDTTTKDTAFLATLQHLVSPEHKRNVITFLKEMGSNENRNKFYVQKALLKQFVNGEAPRDDSPDSTPENTPVSTPRPTFTLTYTTTSTPDGADKTPNHPKTVSTASGIRQNPTGWDNGERVWGGGIIKYKREGEWQPWPIDLDNETDAFDTSTLMGGAIIPGLLIAASPQNNIVVDPATTTNANGAFTHPSLATAPDRKITEYAYSSELSRVDIALPAGQGNVHSGATPPWMLDESGGTIPTITPFMPLSERERRGKKNMQDKRNRKGGSKKIGSNIDRSKLRDDNPNFLPNFGSVWTAGPRSETMKNFRDFKPSAGGDAANKFANKRKFQDV